MDGNRDTNLQNGFCTHTLESDNPWWRLDLNKSYYVSIVRITNRMDCCWERILNAQIRIGDSVTNNGSDNSL